MEPPKKEQGDEVLKQLSRHKPCRLTQGQLEMKAPAHGRRNLLDQKTWNNTGLNWGGIKLQRSSNWTLANPEIPRKSSQSQKGHQEQQMTEGTFILYTTKRNRIRSHLPAIDRLNRSLPKETKEGTRLHKGSQYIVPGLCTPGYR